MVYLSERNVLDVTSTVHCSFWFIVHTSALLLKCDEVMAALAPNPPSVRKRFKLVWPKIIISAQAVANYL